jgi:hypothetical protein
MSTSLHLKSLLPTQIGSSSGLGQPALGRPKSPFGLFLRYVNSSAWLMYTNARPDPKRNSPVLASCGPVSAAKEAQ